MGIDRLRLSQEEDCGGRFGELRGVWCGLIKDKAEMRRRGNFPTEGEGRGLGAVFCGDGRLTCKGKHLVEAWIWILDFSVDGKRKYI